MALTKFNSEAGFSVGAYPAIDVIDRNANITANSLQATGAVDLGIIGNLTITGGNAGQYLQTDGSGTLVFANVDLPYARGPNLAVQYNNTSAFSGDNNFTYDPTTGTVNAIAFAGDGSKLSSITGANVVGVVANANYAAFANVTLNSLAANTTQFVIGNSQPNITNVGNLEQLNVIGNILAEALVANSSLLVQGDATVNGNLIVQGTAIYSNVQTLNVKDPILELGGDPFGGALVANDYINRGILVHYYDGIPLKGFMGWDSNANGYTFASNISLTNNEVIIHNLGNITAQNFIGNGVGITEIEGGNVTGIVANANFAQYGNYASFAGNVTASNQPNITTVGSLGNLTVLGTSNLGNAAVANFLVGDGGYLSNIKGPNVVGTVANANYALYTNYANTAETVTIGAQPNITSVGTLTGLNVDGTITGDEATFVDDVTAAYFIGDGYQLSNITGANVTGTVANASNANSSHYATHVLGAEQPNITSVGTLTSLAVTGNISGNVITGNLFVGNGSHLSNITGANVSEVPNANFATYSGQANNSNFAGNVTVADQPNITSLGTLVRLDITGNLTAGNANLGNMVKANFIDANGYFLTYTAGPNVVGLVANANHSWHSNAANFANLASFANTVVFANQPNITSVGTLTNLSVSGNIISGNASLGNFVQANFFSGNGYYLTDLQAANIVGTVANANYANFAGNATQANHANTANTVTNAAQPNITSVGTLTSLTVSGNVSAQNANLGNIAVANFFVGDGSNLSLINGANVSEVPNANFASYSEQANNANYATSAVTAGTVTTAAQPNITSVGTLTDLTVTGNITTGNLVSLLDVTAVNYFGNAYNLFDINGANVSEVPNANFATYSGQADNANTAVKVTSSSQPNITSVGSLVDLDVIGNISVGNINDAETITATFFVGSGASLSDINGANVSEVANANYATYSGQADNANTAGTITASSQPNITSVGTLTSLSVTGNVSAGNVLGGNAVSANYFVGNGAFLTGVITGIDDTIANGNSNITIFETSVGLSANGVANVMLIGKDTVDVIGSITATGDITVDNVISNLITGTLTTSAQPNITTVGTLDELTVDGNVTANYFIGNVVGNIQGTLQAPGGNTQIPFNQNGNLGATDKLQFNYATNTLSVIGNISTSNNLTRDSKVVTTFVSQPTAPTNAKMGDQWYDTDNDVIYQYIYNGTTFAWIDISSGFTSSDANAIPQTLALRDDEANLKANGFVGNTIQVTDAVVTGNLTVSGNITYVSTTNIDVKDPIIELGGGPNGAALTQNDGYDRGSLLHLYQGSNTVDAFMGWDNSNAEFTLASNVTLDNNVVTINQLGNIRAAYFIGDGSQLANIPASAVQGGVASVDANITSIVPGSAIGVSMDYSDPLFPAGKFMIYQLGPVSLTVTNNWQSSSLSSKNAYANFLANSINTSNVRMTFSLANAVFNVQSTDTITIGGSVVTGANLLAIGITGNSGTYTIPNDYFATSVQTNATSTVSANLTTSRGVYTGSGTTLTTAQPVAYNVNSITGSFPVSSVPYWNLNQSFNWSVSVTGTTASGNLTYSGGVVTTTSLSSTGQTSGTSGSINSTSSYTITTNDYTGAGLNGYGTRTIPNTVNGTVNAATKYYPLFWKITANSTLPTFTVTDSRNNNNFAINQSANTSTTVSDYLWMAVPNSGNAATLQSRTFKHIFGGFDIIDTPTVTGTQTISANGESYNYSIYGFSGFSQTSSIIVTS
jgi:hypothetical protein